MKVLVDSNAALGVVNRKGNGKLIHVKIGHLWIQQLAEDGRSEFAKVGTRDNPADLGTKNLAKSAVEKHMSRINQHISNDRAEKSLQTC